MIRFACKDIDFVELVKCSFDLNKTDYTVFDFLMKKEGEFSVVDLANILSLERSGIQKAIRTLVEKELIIRKQRNLDKGGYKFYYSIKDKYEIKERIEKIIDGWHLKVKEKIKNWY